MRPIREYMRDKRVAAVLVAAAALAVGYRLMESRAVSPVPSEEAVEAPRAATGSAKPAYLPGVRAPLPLPAPMPAGGPGPAWKWDRNPFLSPSAERLQGTVGGAGPDGGTASGADADSSVPTLRGTVVSKGAGAAIFRDQGADGGDRLVPLGGTIGEWTLAEVEPYRVSIRKGKETRVLELYRQ